MFRIALILIIITSVSFLTQAQKQVSTPSETIWQLADESKAICLRSQTDSTGLWVDCIVDAEGIAFSGPKHPDPRENSYQLRGDTLRLYSAQSEVDDVEGGDVPILYAVYVIKRLSADRVMTEPIYPNLSAKSQIYNRIGTQCRMLSHDEYRYGWDILSDSIQTYTCKIPLFSFTSNDIMEFVKAFCLSLKDINHKEYSIEMSIERSYLLLNAYPCTDDIYIDFDAVCNIDEYHIFFQQKNMESYMQPSADSIDVPLQKRTIIYKNGFKRIEKGNPTPALPVKSKYKQL